MNRFVPAIILALAPTLGSAAAETCGPGEPSCYESHSTPGCLQPQCCDLVCEVDDFCCIGSWDEFCVELAEGLCQDVVCPEEGDCFEVHDGTGCIEETCCEFIRLHDPFCSFGTWDRLCVAEAERWCVGAATTCPIAPPPDATFEAEPCRERLNDGCGAGLLDAVSQTVGCGGVVYGKMATGGPRDVDWYRVDREDPGDLVVTLRSEFPARLLLVSGRCEGPIRTEAIHAVDGCGESTFAFAPPEDDWYLVIEPGVAERVVRSGLPCDEIDPDDPPLPDEEPAPREYGLHYLLTISCGTPCVGDLDGDGVVGGADLGLMFVEWGPCVDCAADLDGDGVVGGSDLGGLFVAWGPC